MNTHPRILASYVQGALETIDGLGDGPAHRVRERLKPGSIARIEAAEPATWLDLDVHVELSEAFFAVAGEERARQVLRSATAEAFAGPLLRPMIDGALALFGNDPAHMLRWSSKVWSLLSRDCGRLDLCDRCPSSAVLCLVQAPPALRESPCVLDGIGAAIVGFFDVAGHRADHALRSAGIPAERPALAFRW